MRLLKVLSAQKAIPPVGGWPNGIPPSVAIYRDGTRFVLTYWDQTQDRELAFDDFEYKFADALDREATWAMAKGCARSALELLKEGVTPREAMQT